MISDWLLGIRGWLLEVKGGGFLFRPHLGTSPCVRASHPPTPPAESWTGGIMFFWLFVKAGVPDL